MGIRLVPHDPAWADVYRQAEADIRAALGTRALSIDHVGSTAIPGIDAKPFIDILVLVERYDPESAYVAPLASLGYVRHHRDEDHVFFEGQLVGMSAHVHVVERSSQRARAMVLFRDYLRAHPEEATRYEHLKRTLADRHSDVNDYAEAKSEYVEGVLRLAGSTG